MGTTRRRGIEVDTQPTRLPYLGLSAARYIAEARELAEMAGRTPSEAEIHDMANELRLSYGERTIYDFENTRFSRQLAAAKARHAAQIRARPRRRSPRLITEGTACPENTSQS